LPEVPILFVLPPPRPKMSSNQKLPTQTALDAKEDTR
jgi:hypothetical protein